MFAKITDAVNRADEGPKDLARPLANAVRQGYRFAREHQAAMRLIMRPLIDRGEMEQTWRETAFVPFLDRMTNLLAKATKRPKREIRFDVQSVNAVAFRYALSSPHELAQLAGLPADTTPENAIRYTEKRLVAFALRLFKDY